MQLSLLCFNGGNMVDLVGFVMQCWNKISDKECSAVINIEEECSTGSF